MENKENNYIKHTFNPFEKMDEEAKYGIGYIFADGHLVYNNRQYWISLFSKEKSIIQKFQTFIGKDAKFYERPTGIYECRYHSKPVTKGFMDTFKIPQKKALVLDPAITIDWDILHGYFDGDGSIRRDKDKGKYNRYEMKFTTGSTKGKDRIVEFLKNEGINPYISPKGNAFDIVITGKANLYYMYKHLYQNKTSKLDYKYDQFVALFGDE